MFFFFLSSAFFVNYAKKLIFSKFQLSLKSNFMICFNYFFNIIRFQNYKYKIKKNPKNKMIIK